MSLWALRRRASDYSNLQRSSAVQPADRFELIRRAAIRSALIERDKTHCKHVQSRRIAQFSARSLQPGHPHLGTRSRIIEDPWQLTLRNIHGRRPACGPSTSVSDAGISGFIQISALRLTLSTSFE